MEYLYLMLYIIALAVVGYVLWRSLKDRGLYSKKDVLEYDNSMEDCYGKKGYSMIKIIGGIFIVLFWIYMLGQCSQNYLKI